VKDENGDLLVDDVRQIEIHTAEPSVLGPSNLEIKFKIIYFSSG
jgi:hypothetical protein